MGCRVTAARKLPFLSRDQWASRWLVLPSWHVLHRVRRLYVAGRKHTFEQWPVANGVTVCGLRGSLAMPGFPSRLGLPRCRHCCRIVGVPMGNGAPYNAGIDA